MFAGESFFFVCATCGEAIGNFAHLCECCANILGEVGGMYKLVKDTKKAGNLRLIGGGSGVEIVFGFSPNFSWCLLKFDNQYQ